MLSIVNANRLCILGKLLIVAIWNHMEDLVEEQLNIGVSPNYLWLQYNGDQFTNSHSIGKFEEVSSLSYNQVDFVGTPLHFAVYQRNCEIIGLLLQHGAIKDINSKDSTGLCVCGDCDRPNEPLQPRSTPRHIESVVDEMSRTGCSKKTDGGSGCIH